LQSFLANLGHGEGNPQFNNQQRIIQPGPGGMPHNAVVGGPVNGLRLGPGRPNGPTNVHLGPGPGGIPGMRPNFPVITAHNRFFPIARGQRFVWWGGYRRTFVPLAVLGVVVIGGSYWYPTASTNRSTLVRVQGGKLVVTPLGKSMPSDERRR
jgi:hypothetical protein